MTEHKTGTDILLQETSHDINIVDRLHSDNSITITKIEAVEVMRVLREILNRPLQAPSPEGKGMKHLSFDCLSSQVKAHPQQVMKSLGITYEQVVPNSLYDRWWFFNCKNIPTPLPSYLKSFEESGIEAKDCVGHGLSKEDAEHFTNSPSPEKEPCESEKFAEHFAMQIIHSEAGLYQPVYELTLAKIKEFETSTREEATALARREVKEAVEELKCKIYNVPATHESDILGKVYNQALADLSDKIK